MKTKAFDCVVMKHDIQQRLRSERGHKPWSERNAMIQEVLRSDPHLCRLLYIASHHVSEPKAEQET